MVNAVNGFENKKCYIYTRVANNNVEGMNALEMQRRSIEEFASKENMDVVGRYSDTASAFHKTGFLQMMDDIRKNKDGVNYVLVSSLSRISRNTKEILTYIQDMQNYGVYLICVKDHLDSSSEIGKLMISILSAMVENGFGVTQTLESVRESLMKGGV